MADIDEIESRVRTILQNNLGNYLSEIAADRGDGKTPSTVREYLDHVQLPMSFPAVIIQTGQKEITYQGTKFPEKIPVTIYVLDHNEDDVGAQRIGEAIESLMNDFGDLQDLVAGIRFLSSTTENPGLQGISSPPIFFWAGSWQVYNREVPDLLDAYFYVDASLSMKTFGEFVEKNSISETIPNTPVFAVDEDYAKSGGGQFLTSFYPSNPSSTGATVAGVTMEGNIWGDEILENQSIDHLLVVDNVGKIYLQNEFQFHRGLGEDRIIEISNSGDLLAEGRFIPGVPSDYSLTFKDNGDIVFGLEFSRLSEIFFRS